MVQPNLINPVPIEIEQLDISTTIYDDDFREPIAQASRTTKVTIKGQVKWETKDGLRVMRGGVEEIAAGYVLFRLIDLAANNITLRQNDRFTKLGTEITDIYIIALRPEGHYADIGGPTLVKAFFADRQPTRQ
jgi:hypothetical protein